MSDSDSVERTADGGRVVEELELEEVDLDAAEAKTANPHPFRNARDELPNKLNALREGKSVPYTPDDPSSSTQEDIVAERDALREHLAPATSERGLGLVDVRRVIEDDSIVLRIRARQCGITTVALPGGGEHLLRIPPKLEGEEVDVTSLVRLAVRHRETSSDFFELDHRAKITDTKHRTPLAMVVALYRDALDGFFARGKGLRRLHRSRDETLTGRRRGKVRIRKYMSNIANGRALDVPCRHPSHELDNLPNRALLTALKTLIRASGGEAAGGGDSDLEELPTLRECRPRFAGVGDEPVEASELGSLQRLPESFSHYETLDEGSGERPGPLPIACWIIENFDFEREPGAIHMPGMSFDMASIFEDAFARTVEEAFDEDLVAIQDEWTYELEKRTRRAEPLQRSKGSGTKWYEPDVFVEGNDERRPMVLDTKWKDAISNGSRGDEEAIDLDELSVHPSSADVQQISSYARLAARASDRDHEPIAALVYPSMGLHDSRDEEPTGLHWCVRWSDETSDVNGPEVYILGWDVDELEVEGGEVSVCEQLRRIASLEGGD